MSERTEFTHQTEGVRLLQDRVDRKLIVIRSRSGILYEALDNWLVRNQAQFGKGTRVNFFF